MFFSGGCSQYVNNFYGTFCNSILMFGLKFGPYIWKTYKEVYEEVMHIGSALRASGAEPVSIVYLPYAFAISLIIAILYLSSLSTGEMILS